MKASAKSRRNFVSGSGATLLAAGCSPGLFAAAAPAFNIRTITAGINVGRSDYRDAIEAAMRLLEDGKAILEAGGFTVQTKRIVTQASASYLAGLQTKEVLSFIGEMKQAVGANYLFATGPLSIVDSYSAEQVDRAVGIAQLGVSASISLGTRHSGIHHQTIKVAAETISRLAAGRPEDNFNFAGIANVQPGIPFLPAGYHGDEEPSFAIGTEGASLFMRVCKEVGGFIGAERALVDAYTKSLREVEALGFKIAAETGWRYTGIDTTPAQWGEQSIGTAIESLTGAPFGAPGTLAACQLLTKVIKSVPVMKTGYQGLFLPPLEDATLARRAYDYYGLSSLLGYSAVCGTGLDTVAIPGDSSLKELQRILLDVASLAIRLDKPLTARLFPVPGKHAGESSGAIGNLFPMKILRVS
jgi:uncharacterized protein (UPF0210 family)